MIAISSIPTTLVAILQNDSKTQVDFNNFVHFPKYKICGFYAKILMMQYEYTKYSQFSIIFVKACCATQTKIKLFSFCMTPV